jgi:hypothetical protein
MALILKPLPSRVGLFPTAAGGGGGGIPFYQQLEYYQLGSDNQTWNTDTFEGKDHLMILMSFKVDQTNADPVQMINGTSSGDGSGKLSFDGGSDASYTSDDYNLLGGFDNDEEIFNYQFWSNYADELKLGTYWAANNWTYSAGMPVRRVNGVFKWSETSAQITKLYYDCVQTSGSRQFKGGVTEVVFLGYNDGDTAGTGVWEELTSKELTSPSTTFESDIISSPKRYMWLQAEFDSTNAGGVQILKAAINGTYGNGDNRYNDNFTSDSDQEDVTYGIVSPAGAGKVQVNVLINNIPGRKKLLIHQGQNGEDVTPPVVTNGVFGYDATVGQINRFNFSNADGHNLDNGIMKVWGFDPS